MSRCFCGCGRRVLIRGRVANLYGGNAAKLAAEMAEAVEAEKDEEAPFVPPNVLPFTPANVPNIRDGLTSCAADYRAVVHGEQKLSELSRLDYVVPRDEALTVLAAFRHWITESPQRRRAALGQWVIDSGLTEEEIMARLRENPAEVEQIISGYERGIS
jgi:hypothetical protein